MASSDATPANQRAVNFLAAQWRISEKKRKKATAMSSPMRRKGVNAGLVEVQAQVKQEVDFLKHNVDEMMANLKMELKEKDKMMVTVLQHLQETCETTSMSLKDLDKEMEKKISMVDLDKKISMELQTHGDEQSEELFHLGEHLEMMTDRKITMAIDDLDAKQSEKISHCEERIICSAEKAVALASRSLQSRLDRFETSIRDQLKALVPRKVFDEQLTDFAKEVTSMMRFKENLGKDTVKNMEFRKRTNNYESMHDCKKKKNESPPG